MFINKEFVSAILKSLGLITTLLKYLVLEELMVKLMVCKKIL